MADLDLHVGRSQRDCARLDGEVEAEDVFDAAALVSKQGLEAAREAGVHLGRDWGEIGARFGARFGARKSEIWGDIAADLAAPL